MVSSDGDQLETHKFLTVIAYLVCAAFSNWITLAYIHDIVGRTPMPDIIFNLIDEKPWAVYLGDFMVMLCSASIITLFIFHKQRIILMRRICFIIAVLYTLRTILMLSTQLPSSYKDNEARCRRALNASERTFSIYLERTFEQAFHLGFQDSDKKMLCGDLLFSGHTLIMVMAVLSVDYYAPEKFKYLKYLVRLCALVGICCMVISRTHYTCDVVVAYLCAVGVFVFYHAFCEIDEMDRHTSVLRRFHMVRIISWLEKDVHCDHPMINKFEVPPAYYQIKQLWTNPDKREHQSETQQQNRCTRSNGAINAQPVYQQV